MNEGQYKKKMEHFLKINNDLYKENQDLKLHIKILSFSSSNSKHFFSIRNT
jgi:hypothetical protein